MHKDILEKIINGESLKKENMYSLANSMFEGCMNDVEIGAILTALKSKGESYEEISGMAYALREKSQKYKLDQGKYYDIVGTGGDKLNTFNISTASAFVISGCGVNVVKHGNRSVSSNCGSMDVLEAVGIKIDTNSKNVESSIESSGLGFIYAQNAHPVMKNVGPARKMLGIPTIFNLVGPIANPVDLDGIMLGVYKPELIEVMSKALLELGIINGAVVHGYGGMDELSLEGDNIVVFMKDGALKHSIVNCKEYGISNQPNKSLVGGDKSENARILLSVLKNEDCVYKDAVIFNSGVALYSYGVVDSISEGIRSAEESIKSGKAYLKYISVKKVM